MVLTHNNLKRGWVTLLVFALLALPYHSVSACCCAGGLSSNISVSTDCCCQRLPSPIQSYADADCSTVDCSSGCCKSCQHDCQCQKRIEQNKVVRTSETSAAQKALLTDRYVDHIQHVNIVGLLLVTLDRAWVHSTHNQRRAMQSVWLK